MIIKRFFKQIPLLVAVLTLVGMVGCWPVTAVAQTNDIGAGGATSIIGLPSSGSDFQNAASKAQSGAYNSPVGGSNLLKEDKNALVIVDAPAYSGSSVDTQVPSASVWWLYVLIFIALISLIGIILVFWANKYGQMDNELDTEEKEPLLEEVEPLESLTTDELSPEKQTDTEFGEAEVAQVISEATESAGIQVVDFEEAAPEPSKTTKKRKHGGRSVKKSHK